MADVFVGTYILHLYPSRSKSTVSLGALDSGDSVYDSVLATLDSLKKKVKPHKTSPHLLRVLKLHQDGTNIWGLLERGEYGFTAGGIHRETFRETYKRSADDAEMIPFYFRFHLPSNEHYGVLILQRLGVHGAFIDVRDAITDAIKEAHPSFNLRVGRLVPTSIIDALTKGGVKAIKVISYTRTGDRSDTFIRGYAPEVGAIERVYKAERDGFLWKRMPKKILEMMAGTSKMTAVFPDADKVQVKVDYNGRTRNFDLSKMTNAAPYIQAEDVPTREGHPIFNKMNDYCIALQQELVEQITQGS